MLEKTPVPIESRDYWVKIVDMLQQNWALIDKDSIGGFTVFFVNDRSGVFDRIPFDSIDQAAVDLRRNGFKRFVEEKESTEFLVVPEPPFLEVDHPNGPIYSSGKFWK